MTVTAPPAKLGKYDVIGEIGRGAMGVVYRGFDPALERPVAIKVMNAAALSIPDVLKRFRLEAKAVAKLQHPNIVTIHDLQEDDAGVPQIVMELLEGENLAQRLAHELPSVKEALQLVIQICHGLHHAHERDLVHRDIKPANVFLTRDGIVKLTDFGVARWAESELTTPGTIIGTAEYMSPEQMRGESVDRRTDIFGVGVILYRLLTGRRPFKSGRLETLLFQIVHTPIEHVDFHDGASRPELERIVLRSLAKDPDERYSSAREMLEELCDWLTLHGGDEASGIRALADLPPPMEPKAALALLKKHTGSEKDFPILRQTAVSLLQLPCDGGAADAAEIILRDPALTAKILKVANSAYFNRAGSRVDSVVRAATVLGLDLVRNVCLGLGFAEAQERRYGGELRRLSAQAFFAASMGKELGLLRHHPNPEEVFTGALLHNLPKMALACHLPDVHEYIGQLVATNGLRPVDAERRALSVPLNKVGISMATRWKLPDVLADAMGACDAAVSSRASSPGAITRTAAYLTNAIAVNILTEAGTEQDLLARLNELDRALGVDHEQAVAMIQRAHQRTIDFAGPFGIELNEFEPPGRSSATSENRDTLRESLVHALYQYFDVLPEDA